MIILYSVRFFEVSKDNTCGYTTNPKKDKHSFETYTLCRKTDEYCQESEDDPEECKKETFELILYPSSFGTSGDVNLDSAIDILDIIVMINIIMGEEITGNYSSENADINNDNIIDILDAVTLVNIILYE